MDKNVFQPFQIFFPVIQIGPPDAVAQFPVFPFQIFRMIIHADTQIKSLHILSTFHDIPTVLILHIIVGASPERKKIVENLLKLQKRRGRLPA